MKHPLSIALLTLFACGTAATPELTAEPGAEPVAEAVAPEAAHHEGHHDGTAAAPAGAPAPEGWDGFGGTLVADHIVTASTLLDDPKAFLGQTVVVEGRVADVCQKAGCWMVVTDGGRNMRVRMKEHGFSVAKDGTGRDCRVQGEVVALPVDPETVAHFKGEAARPEVMPESALPAGAEVTYELVASAVHLRR
jgi:hypothetical protein